MLQPLLSSIEYGGYISLAKLLSIIVAFYVWLLLSNWIHKDARAVRTNVNLWLSIILVAGFLGLLVWMFVPLFIVGSLVYIIAVLAVTMIYIIHRNSRVASFEKILNIEHFKRLFSNDAKKMAQASKGLQFITANGNDVDTPEANSKEAYGFKVACELLTDFLWRRVSDAALMPGTEEYSVSVTIDGVVTKSDPLDREDVEYLIYFIKQLADLDVEEKRKPQNGSFKIRKDGDAYEWEVSTAGSRVGEQLKFHRAQEHNIVSIEDVGFDSKQIESIKALKEVKDGLVLIAGPKESGVTSTLYTLLRNHDAFLNSIVTLEKRPAGEIESVTQNIFSLSDTGTSTYDKRLKSIVRFGPDIVGVGDVEDSETAIICNESAKKKLIYVTIESPNCLDAMKKWIKLSKDKSLATENLRGIVTVRLMRKLCEECREAYEPNPATLKKLNIKPGSVTTLYRPGEVEYTRSGKPIYCDNCQGTGFYGRTAVFETVFINEQMREAINKAKTMQEIALIFRKSGMLLMQEQAIKKVAQGELAMHEVVRALKTAAKSTSTSKKKKA